MSSLDPRQGPSAPTPAEDNDWRSVVRGSGRNQLIVLVVTGLLVVLGAWFVGHRAPEETMSGGTALNNAQSVEVTGAKDGPAPEVGKPAQDFRAATVKGTPISLAALKGKPVWLTFGASWCTACRAESPDIQDVYAKEAKAKGFEIVAVNIQEDPPDVVAYAGKVGLTYPSIADPQTVIASRYRVMGLPSHYFIDKDGILRSIHVGGLTRSAMDTELAKIAP